jgi:hypothetical protein
MRSKSNSFKTPSYTSPKGGTRGCLCADGTYNVKCCDGSLQAQGIGNIYGVRAVVIDYFLLQENGDYILQQNNDKIILNG